MHTNIAYQPETIPVEYTVIRTNAQKVAGHYNFYNKHSLKNQITMIHSKYKNAHYQINRFQSLPKVEKWFENQDSYLSDEDMMELWQYFIKKCKYDLHLMSICDQVKNRDVNIIRTANILRYCHDNVQKVLRAKTMKMMKEKFPDQFD